MILLTLYLCLSTLTFLAYALDKFAAGRGRVRVSESTLHLLALCGGWPGALAGQRLLRHKTHKLGFQLGFWLTVLLNFVLLLGYYRYR